MNEVVRTLKHTRGPVGKLIKWLFIGFNFLMLFWLFTYWGDVAPMIDNGSSAEQAGAAIGSTIGTGLILMAWGLGAVVLGIPVLLTKGKLVEIENSSTSQRAPAPEDTPHTTEATTEESASWKEKMISIIKETLQTIGIILFLVVGIAFIFDNSLIEGLAMIAAGSLLLQSVQEKLKATPLRTPKSIAITMVLIVWTTIYFGSLDVAQKDPKGHSENTKQSQNRMQDLRKDAEKAFAKKPDQVLQDIKTYAQNNNWKSVHERTELLLKTDNAEIKALYDEAVNELAKAEEAKQKQAEELLANEFAEKRDKLIGTLKEELSLGNYQTAKNIGSKYIEVADKEFKDLHNSALQKHAIEAAAETWHYTHRDDPMSTGKTHHAILSSSNTVNFDFPYQGVQHGTLTLRTHPKHGKDVIFNIDKGQILCPSYSSCKVRVRFDEANATLYNASGAADNSTETIFIRNYSQFVGKMMKAKRVRISMNIYQEGAPVFDFDVSGFNVKKYKPPQ